MSAPSSLRSPRDSPQLDLRRLRDVRPRDLAVRFVFGALTSIVSAMVSLGFGPRVGGLLLAFPATLAASLTLVASDEGKEDAREDARGAVLGAIGLGCFALVGACLFEKLPGAVVLALGSMAWAMVAIGVYRLLPERG